ncbi:hypothetical protein, partial [Burkholderia ubonensis]|uniref:hypothetical protein n=1 Tax=Burkholderia ubonensis TaxID=101571 RepID=UPI001E5CC2ED
NAISFVARLVQFGPLSIETFHVEGLHVRLLADPRQAHQGGELCRSSLNFKPISREHLCEKPDDTTHSEFNRGRFQKSRTIQTVSDHMSHDLLPMRPASKRLRERGITSKKQDFIPFHTLQSTQQSK